MTDRYIGVGETLLVTSINGLIFALFAAQPLLIVGATGPLMIFDMSLLQVSTFNSSFYMITMTLRGNKYINMEALIITLLFFSFVRVWI